MSKESGITTVDTGLDTYRLKFDMNSWEKFEEETDLWFTDVANALGAGRVSVSLISKAIWAGLIWQSDNPYSPADISQERGQKVLNEAVENDMTLTEISEQVITAMMNAIPEAREAMEEAADVDDEDDIKNNN